MAGGGGVSSGRVLPAWCMWVSAQCVRVRARCAARPPRILLLSGWRGLPLQPASRGPCMLSDSCCPSLV